MADVVDAATRSRMMAGIRGKDTKPEMELRRALHRRGFRYALHRRDVPGKPDLVFPARDAVVFVHGCFWHGHDCRFFRMPSTRTEFWSAKIAANQRRDVAVAAELNAAGWRRMVVWECATRGAGKDAVESVADRVASWLRFERGAGEIRGE